MQGFLTPQVDPEMEGPELPTKADQEFRPFVRRLPEMKFWSVICSSSCDLHAQQHAWKHLSGAPPCAATAPRFASFRSVSIGLFLTFFSIFDVPVFWPILLLYWFALFYVTMSRQIRHMIKYRWAAAVSTLL